MTWLVNESVDREMYRLSRAICEGATVDVAKRHQELCRLHVDVPRPMPRNTEPNRQAAATAARKAAGRKMDGDHLATLIKSGLDEFTPTTVSDTIGCTRKLAADRLRGWTDRGLMEHIGYTSGSRHQGRYQLTEKGRNL